MPPRHCVIMHGALTLASTIPVNLHVPQHACFVHSLAEGVEGDYISGHYKLPATKLLLTHTPVGRRVLAAGSSSSRREYEVDLAEE
jgi:hypothetical protein